jgi:mRNA interferase HicA
MKRRELLRHLNNHGREPIREGGNHSWWLNPLKNKRSAIPGHFRDSGFIGAKDL